MIFITAWIFKCNKSAKMCFYAPISFFRFPNFLAIFLDIDQKFLLCEIRRDTLKTREVFVANPKTLLLPDSTTLTWKAPLMSSQLNRSFSSAIVRCPCSQRRKFVIMKALSSESSNGNVRSLRRLLIIVIKLLLAVLCGILQKRIVLSP